MKLPVISSKSGALPEVLSNSCAFFISRGKNFVPNLEDKMQEFIDNLQLQHKMGMSGFERVNKYPNTSLEYFNLIYKALNN